MQSLYVRAMNGLYRACIAISIVSLIAMTVLVFAGAMARDLLGFGAMYSEQLSIMLAIQLTFYGAAACFRAHAHLALTLFVRVLPQRVQSGIKHLVTGLFIAVGAGMVFWGIDLVQTTMFQHYAEFPWERLKVGYIYTAVPISGAITVLFALEQLFYFRGTEGFHGDEALGARTETDIIRRARESRG